MKEKTFNSKVLSSCSPWVYEFIIIFFHIINFIMERENFPRHWRIWQLTLTFILIPFKLSRSRKCHSVKGVEPSTLFEGRWHSRPTIVVTPQFSMTENRRSWRMTGRKEGRKGGKWVTDGREGRPWASEGKEWVMEWVSEGVRVLDFNATQSVAAAAFA